MELGFGFVVGLGTVTSGSVTVGFVTVGSVTVGSVTVGSVTVGSDLGGTVSFEDCVADGFEGSVVPTVGLLLAG